MSTFTKYFVYAFFFFTWLSASQSWFTFDKYSFGERSTVQILMTCCIVIWAGCLEIMRKLDDR